MLRERIKRHLTRRRERCPRHRLANAALAGALLMGPVMPQCAGGGGPVIRGQAYVTVACSGHGIQYRIHVQRFEPKTKINYHVRVVWNGVVKWTGLTPNAFPTDSQGNHFSFVSVDYGMNVECGAGHYMVEAYARNLDGTIISSTGYDETTCYD